jgi:hypothetical protein
MFRAIPSVRPSPYLTDCCLAGFPAARISSRRLSLEMVHRTISFAAQSAPNPSGTAIALCQFPSFKIASTVS